jgi:hypothetical protein
MGNDGTIFAPRSHQRQQSPRHTASRRASISLTPTQPELIPRKHQVSAGKFLENNVPVFVITFATQEVLLFRNAKSGEVVVGAEDRVEQCHYAAVITRAEEGLANELTGGWKVIEVGPLVSSQLRPGLTPLLSPVSRRWRGGRHEHIYSI